MPRSAAAAQTREQGRRGRAGAVRMKIKGSVGSPALRRIQMLRGGQPSSEELERQLVFWVDLKTEKAGWSQGTRSWLERHPWRRQGTRAPTAPPTPLHTTHPPTHPHHHHHHHKHTRKYLHRIALPVQHRCRVIITAYYRQAAGRFLGRRRQRGLQTFKRRRRAVEAQWGEGSCQVGCGCSCS